MNNISEVYEKTIELIDFFCEKGKECNAGNNYEEAERLFSHALHIAKYFAREEETELMFMPVVARCMYYQSEAMQDEKKLWKAVVLATKYYKQDYFCNFIVKTGKRKFNMSDEIVEVLSQD